MATILIVGGGKVGSHLARRCLDQHDGVRLVEVNPKRASDLQARLPGATIVCGSGTDAAILEAAGIHTADVLAAVTGADETNLVVCATARFSYDVSRTVARVNDPRNAWMFGEDLGVDAAVDQAELVGALVSEEMSVGAMTILLKLGRGRFSLVEERLTGDAPIVGRPVTELTVPEKAVPVAIIRQGRLMAAHQDLLVAVGDEVLVIVHEDALAEIARHLGAAP